MDTLDIGSRRELFVDHYLIETLSGDARLRLQHPQSAGAVFYFDQPWEGAFSGYCTVLKDEDTVRLYYRGWDDSHDMGSAVTCLSESQDGITFRRPDLGLYEVHGTLHNNVMIAGDGGAFTHNFAPALDTRPGVPREQRYKAMTRNYGFALRGQREDPMGLLTFASEDGIHWDLMHDAPVITDGAFDSQNVAFWSEHENCYLCYFRIFEDDVRSIARARSDDFIHWGPTEPMQYGDTPREHLYTNQTLPYFRAPHIYIALPGRFMPDRQVLSDTEGAALGIRDHNGRGYWHDVSDAVLMTSRGGPHYDRTFMEAFVRPGRDRRDWTSRCNYPARGIIQTAPDAMSIYVERHNAQDGKYLERMVLRLDGFAALHAGYSGGCAVTKLFRYTGGQLNLNYATGAAGHIRAALLDEEGDPLPGCSFEDCSSLVGDEIETAVLWRSGVTLSKYANQPVRLAFELKDADVFAFQFRDGN